MTTDLELLGTPQRQSGWAVAFLAFRAVRRIGIGQLVVFALFLGRLPAVALLVLVPFVVLIFLAVGIIGWWRFTFVIDDQELRVTKGIVSEDRLSVPLDRVQSVSIEQGFLHRLIGLVAISLDTAGTADAEFVIDTVDASVAHALQRVTAQQRTIAPPDTIAATTAPPPEVVVIQRDLGRLLKAGLARPAFSGLAVLFPLFAAADELGPLIPFDPPDIDGGTVGSNLLWLLPVGVALAIVAGLLLNLAQVILTQWNLSLAYHDGGFRRSAGLISRTSRATNVARIQSVSWRRNPIERQLGIRRLRLPTIGEGDLHVPGTDDHELSTLRRLILDPDPSLEAPTRTISSADVFRSTRNATVVALVAGVGFFFVVGSWSALAVLWIGYQAGLARRRVSTTRWQLGATGIVRRGRIVSESSTELALRKVNGVSVRQTFFERARDLATVVVETPAGSVSIGMIAASEAAAVRDRVLYAVETDERDWM
ncbi:MAG: PH domain-containing protein [Actinomycetota bacterium]